ncbi:MAG TPA: DUF2177 family protein [Candidatus Saccharibacteria bacterium]|nr:DUF2177 family protein [Candidatus Saccharibacteria bacterium]
MNYLYAFLTSLGTMAVLDAAWLGFIAPSFYKKHIGFIMTDKPNWLAAIAFYLIFIAGLTIFVVYPGWKESYSLIKIGLLGALFGLVTYATYDLTNQATLKNWPYIVTIVDLIWGTLLTASVSVVAVSILKAVIK